MHVRPYTCTLLQEVPVGTTIHPAPFEVIPTDDPEFWDGLELAQAIFWARADGSCTLTAKAASAVVVAEFMTSNQCAGFLHDHGVQIGTSQAMNR